PPSLLDRLPRLARRVPVVGLDLLDHHPHRFLGQAGDVGDGARHALGDLVLPLLAPALIDADVDEWHAASSERPAQALTYLSTQPVQRFQASAAAVALYEGR